MNPQRTLLTAGLILALVLAAYSNSFKAAFQLDDYHQIVNNYHIRNLTNLPRFFEDGRTGTGLRGVTGFRPITIASFAVNYALSGYRVWGYHALNLLLHAMNALLVFLVINGILAGAGRKDAFAVSLLSSLLFAVHPVQTGAVTYISCRAALLASLFTLSAFYGFIRYRAGGGMAWGASAPALFMLGMLSKETAVALIVLMAVYDLIMTVPRRGGLAASWRIWLYYAPFMAALGVYFAWRKAATGDAIPAGGAGFGRAVYLVSEAKALPLYLRLLFLPVNQNADYYLPATRHIDLGAALGMLLLALAAVFIYRGRKDRPEPAFFGAWFLLALLPEASLVPVPDIAVLYRLYLPSAGIIAATVLILSDALRNTAVKRGLAVLVIALFGVLTIGRNTVWATEYSLWSDVVHKSPRSDRASLNLGKALAEEGRYEDAQWEYMTALAVDPAYPERYYIYANMGLSYFSQGKMDMAMYVLERVVKKYPGFIEAYTNLGEVYLAAGRYGQAVDILKKSAAADPANYRTHLDLGQAYLKLGLYK